MKSPQQGGSRRSASAVDQLLADYDAAPEHRYIFGRQSDACLALLGNPTLAPDWNTLLKSLEASVDDIKIKVGMMLIATLQAKKNAERLQDADIIENRSRSERKAMTEAAHKLIKFYDDIAENDPKARPWPALVIRTKQTTDPRPMFRQALDDIKTHYDRQDEYLESVWTTSRKRKMPHVAALVFSEHMVNHMAFNFGEPFVNLVVAITHVMFSNLTDIDKINVDNVTAYVFAAKHRRAQPEDSAANKMPNPHGCT